MIKKKYDTIQSTSKNETAKTKKAVTGVPSPLITLVAVEIFRNFSPLLPTGS